MKPQSEVKLQRALGALLKAMEEIDMARLDLARLDRNDPVIQDRLREAYDRVLAAYKILKRLEVSEGAG